MTGVETRKKPDRGFMNLDQAQESQDKNLTAFNYLI